MAAVLAVAAAEAAWTGGDFNPTGSGKHDRNRRQEWLRLPRSVHGAGAEGVLQPDWAELKTGELAGSRAAEMDRNARHRIQGPARREMESRDDLRPASQRRGVGQRHLRRLARSADQGQRGSAAAPIAARPAVKWHRHRYRKAAARMVCVRATSASTAHLPPRSENQGAGCANCLNNEINAAPAPKPAWSRCRGGTPEVYACSGASPTIRKWCAAINRAPCWITRTAPTVRCSTAISRTTTTWRCTTSVRGWPFLHDDTRPASMKAGFPRLHQANAWK